MTATPKAYVPRFYSEVVREAGSPDDCVVCASLELYDAATLGEGVTRDDGSAMNTIALRELRDNAGLKPDGPLRLNDAAQYLAYIDERAGMPDPRFKLDYYPGHPGGTLRLSWDEFKARIKGGSIAILLGNPIGIKDPNSPLRTAQNSDDYGHAIAVMDGNDNGARTFDALRYKDPTYKGARVTWADLKAFTEVRKGGERLYGTESAIACAVAAIGSWTVANRVYLKSLTTVAKLNDRLAAQKAQTTLATEERDAARAERDRATSNEAQARRDLEACKAATPVDCSGPLATQKASLIAAVRNGVGGLLDGLVEG